MGTHLLFEGLLLAICKVMFFDTEGCFALELFEYPVCILAYLQRMAKGIVLIVLAHSLHYELLEIQRLLLMSLSLSCRRSFVGITPDLLL